jgi:uncharacterized protein (DUF2062 family)
MFRSTFRRLLAIDDPPERTALAFSIGVFIAFSPFLGLHTIMATFVAFVFRFNKIAIYSGTFVNNPFITLVPIIVLSYGLGALITGRPLRIPDEGLQLLENPAIFSGEYYKRIFVQSWAIVMPYTIGASVLSVVCSLLAYPITLKALRAYRRRKISDST